MASNKNSTLYDVYKQDFMNECAGNVCDDAAQALLSSIDGNSGLFGCDLLQIIYEGDPNAGWHLGWRDNFMNKAGYILNLVNIGISAHATFITIEA